MIKTNNMERIKTYATTGESIEFDLEKTNYYPIEILKKFIKDAELEGADTIEVNYYHCADIGGDVELEAYVSKTETDEEYNARVQRAKNSRQSAQELLDKAERAEYERLKAKFE